MRRFDYTVHAARRRRHGEPRGARRRRGPAPRPRTTCSCCRARATMRRYGAQRDHAFKSGLPLKILARFTPRHAATLGPGDMLYLPPSIAHDGVAVDLCDVFDRLDRATRRPPSSPSLARRRARQRRPAGVAIAIRTTATRTPPGRRERRTVRRAAARLSPHPARLRALPRHVAVRAQARGRVRAASAGTRGRRLCARRRTARRGARSAHANALRWARGVRQRHRGADARPLPRRHCASLPTVVRCPRRASPHCPRPR